LRVITNGDQVRNWKESLAAYLKIYLSQYPNTQTGNKYEDIQSTVQENLNSSRQSTLNHGVRTVYSQCWQNTAHTETQKQQFNYNRGTNKKTRYRLPACYRRIAATIVCLNFSRSRHTKLNGYSPFSQPCTYSEMAPSHTPPVAMPSFALVTVALQRSAFTKKRYMYAHGLAKLVRVIAQK
jgi:hypothetical protein